MKRLLLIALTAGLLAQPAQVTAQQPYFYTGIPDATEYLDFLGGSGVNGGYGVQVGPYLAQFTTPLSPQFSIYCVDYTHFAKDGWVNVTGLGSGNDLGNTRLGLSALEDNTGDYVRYRQAAYLATLFDTGSQPTSEWGKIHAAIWSLTSGVTPGGNTGDYLTATWAAPTTFTTDGWYVLTPTNPGSSTSGQEFLMRTRVSVPEPAGLLLIATGLLMLGMVSRKRIGIEMDA
jgi:hypothetical protein